MVVTFPELHPSKLQSCALFAGFLVSVLPCIAFSENRRMLHGGELRDTVDPCIIYCLLAYLTSGLGCCLYAYGTRTDIRNKYNLKEDPCNDCCVHLLCHPCALCQEYRELKMRPLTEWPLPDRGVSPHSPTAGVLTAPAYGVPHQQASARGGFYQSGYVQISGPPIQAPQPLMPEPPAYAPGYGGQPVYSPQYPHTGQVMMAPPPYHMPVQSHPLQHGGRG
eukprot:evm.model.scf_108.20 EVM.evm.TU.scf_108.20   scf_108:137194-139897(-)